jgi:MSHA pilin protein MshD
MTRSVSGFSLIELIVFIVVVGAALTGVLSALNVSVKGSADPLQPKQALAIAEASLEAMHLKSYADIATPSPASSEPVSGYVATVTVSAATVGGDTAKKIEVSVSTPSSGTLVLTDYRLSY